MPKYKAALFDIDDTLVKTWQVKWRQHKYVAQKYYGIDLTDDVIMAHWGEPFDMHTATFYNHAGTAEERRANFLRHELEFPKDYQPYATEVVHELYSRGVTLGLITSMHMEGARIDLNNLQFPFNYFLVQQGSDTAQHHKPDPRVFEPALQQLGAIGITDRIVYIGDAINDFYAAHGAGLDFIGVTQGFAAHDQFRAAGATNIAADLLQVKDFILEEPNAEW